MALSLENIPKLLYVIIVFLQNDLNLMDFSWNFKSTSASLVPVWCSFDATLVPLWWQFDASLVLVWCWPGASPILFLQAVKRIGAIISIHETCIKVAPKWHQTSTKQASNWHLKGANLQQSCTKFAPVDMKIHGKTIKLGKMMKHVNLGTYWQEFAVSQPTKIAGPSKRKHKTWLRSEKCGASP